MGAVIASRVPAPYSRNPDRIEFGEELDNMGVVQVSGRLRDEVDPLVESITKFRKHHGEVGAALLNIEDGLDENAERPAYVYQAFPTMVYHADGREKIAGNAKEVEELTKAGFRGKPYPKPQIVVGNPAEEKKVLMDQLADRDAKLAKQNEMLLELLEWKRLTESKK